MLMLAKSIRDVMISRIIDFCILGFTFYASCLLLSVSSGVNTLGHTLLYSTVILVSVRLGQYFLSSKFGSFNAVVRIMLCNATGLLAGAIVMLAVGSMIPRFGEFAIAVIFASVMAFFVLGTISPFLKKSAHISKDSRIAS